jgi:hypothetical protein
MLHSIRAAKSQKHWPINVPIAKGSKAQLYALCMQRCKLLNITDLPVTVADIGNDLMDSRSRRECPAARKFTSYMQQELTRARQCLEDAKQRQRALQQKKFTEQPFQVGNWVWLSTLNLRRRMPGTSKLMPKFVGPFKVIKQVNPTTYALDLKDTRKRIHPVFHSSLLKLHKGPVPQKILPIILEDDVQDGTSERYEVECITDHRLTHRRRSKEDGTRTNKVATGLQYLIKWKGYDAIHNTWEPASNVDKSPKLLQEYWQKWCKQHPGEAPLYPVNNAEVA